MDEFGPLNLQAHPGKHWAAAGGTQRDATQPPRRGRRATLPFSTWSSSKLAEFLVAEGVVDDISHEGLRVLLREEGVSFQALKTWKESNDPDFEAKKNRILELYDIADGKTAPGRMTQCDMTCRHLYR